MLIKILFFIEKFGGGGAEKVLRDLVNHMDRSKFDITVQSVWPYEEGKLLNPGIRYKSVYAARNALTEKQYRIEAALGLTYSLRIKDNYDIECAFLESGPTKVIAYSTNRHAAKLAWVHCDLMKYTSEPEQFAKKCSPWYERFDKVVCVSQTAKGSFDELFSNRFESTVLYNYVDDREIREKAAAPIQIQKPDGSLLMLAVGTLYPPKNYPRLLRTFHRLKQERDNLELWILGDGVQRDELQRMAEELQIASSVRFLGFQTNPYPYMQKADLLVCSSNYEGFSTVITEGLILGMPIVTTECSGMRELLGESEYGCVTKNNDEAFYQGVKRMTEDEELRLHYAEKALQKGKTISGESLLMQTEHLLTSIYSDRRSGV